MFTHSKEHASTHKTGLFLSCLILTLLPVQMHAQDISESFSDRFMMQFNQSSDKLVQLAEAMPEEAYTWSPDGEAMTVARVFMHIARYNYLMPSNGPGISIPDDIDLDSLEEIEEKEVVLRELKKSIGFVQDSVSELTPEDLQQPAELFGQQTRRWGTLFMMMTHMSEHLGQAISYARMNGVVPPWSG